MMPVENKRVVLKHYFDGMPSESGFQVQSVPVEQQISASASGSVVVKNLYVSIDPYQLARMKEHSPSHGTSSSADIQRLGEAIPAMGVGRVVSSASGEFQKDDLVAGFLGWEEYTTVHMTGGPPTMLNKITTTDQFPPSYHAGILGSSGFTAYVGFYEVCKPKAGEKVFVSAAAGSVGSIVGQFAKLHGCFVVGCAGSKKKVDLLKEKLGFDDAFNYKEEADLHSALKRYFPDGIDIYFDNVGGDMLEAAIANMKSYGRVAACGVICEYTDKGKKAAPDMLHVVYKRITIRGFLVYDHMNVYHDFISTTVEHLRHGRIHALEDISQGIESVPSAFVGLFRGENVGKKLVQLAEI